MSRWCLLGTVIMFLWLMAPVVKCSWYAFRDTPLSEADPTLNPSKTDVNRVEQSQGFGTQLTTAVQGCYRKTPLLGQEDWKTYLLLALAGATMLTWGLDRWQSRRGKSFES